MELEENLERVEQMSIQNEIVSRELGAGSFEEGRGGTKRLKDEEPERSAFALRVYGVTREDLNCFRPQQSKPKN